MKLDDKPDMYDVLAGRIVDMRTAAKMRDDDFKRYIADQLRWVAKQAREKVQADIKEALGISDDISEAIDRSIEFYRRDE